MQTQQLYLHRFRARLQRFDDELLAKRVKYPVGVWPPSHGVHRTTCMRQRKEKTFKKGYETNSVRFDQILLRRPKYLHRKSSTDLELGYADFSEGDAAETGFFSITTKDTCL